MDVERHKFFIASQVDIYASAVPLVYSSFTFQLSFVDLDCSAPLYMQL